MQKSIFPELELGIKNKWRISSFSANGVYEESARLLLENKYWDLIELSDAFDRKSVSFQLSKNDKLHNWLKYKEGFSAYLVQQLLQEFKVKPGSVVLDPFMGSGTTALVAMLNGMNSMGFDILPMSKIAINAKSNVAKYDMDELLSMLNFIKDHSLPSLYNRETQYLTITKDGYPEKNAKEIQYFYELIINSDFSIISKNIFLLCTLNCLERISYSAKDGQYLRWDYRCPKMVIAAKDREKKGKKPLVVKLNKGDIPTFKQALIQEFSHVISDINYIQSAKLSNFSNWCNFIEGSALYELPCVETESIDAVITSPPYCNRYDYTRTYALELAFLGVDDTKIRKLRQALLSCTVENKSKIDDLQKFYESLNRSSDFNKICRVINSCDALNETLKALKFRASNGEINNKGVLNMVEGYFTELTFVFFELFRVCKKGAYIAFVNDNVRYAGEVIPVDFITTELASLIGFTPHKIYTLKQQKGNSSQQMKKYGRVPLRKSITIWIKE